MQFNRFRVSFVNLENHQLLPKEKMQLLLVNQCFYKFLKEKAKAIL